MNCYDRFCIVRSRDQGVVCGIVRAVSGRTVELSDARQIYLWRTTGESKTLYTLFEVSLYGAGNARISQPIEEFTMMDVCGIYPCTPEAETDLKQSRWDAAYDSSKSLRPAKTPRDSSRLTASQTSDSNL